MRNQVTAAAAFLDWLDTRGLTLAACTQAELDQWLAGNSCHRPGRQLRAVGGRRRHASRLTAPASRWTGPTGPLDQDRRWADARRLLHDDACPLPDRAAGLLILLYAQKLNVITALRPSTSSVKTAAPHAPGQHAHRPARPAGRPRRQARGRAQGTGHQPARRPNPSLFPGRWPGRPDPDALGDRLHALGISSRQGRGAALLTLAAEVPAAILAKMLASTSRAPSSGRRVSSGDWAAYAADISRRLEH